MMRGNQAAGVLRALSDPLRVEILSRLLDGPAAVTELVAATGSTQPNVSNHLAMLRKEGLVRGDRIGRQVRYRLASPTVGQFVEALVSLGGSKERPALPSPLAEARSCYDHLAGRLGVSVLDGLIARKALAPPRAGGAIDLGARAVEIFQALGVDLAAAAKSRRRLAFACLDWTERRAHLGGALGAELLGKLVGSGWVVRQPGSRVLFVSAAGRRGLQRTLGII